MFLGNTVYASDLQQQKIEQLEQLLQSYIEENSILKSENQALKDELQSQKNLATDQTLVAKETCDTSASTCLDDELCEIATFKLLGKQNWKVGSYTIFVDEAKRRGLTCDVAVAEPAAKTEQEIAKQEVETAEVQTTALQRCEADLTGCSKEDLCDTATYGMVGMKNWKVGSYTIFVDEAKRRGLTCGVKSASNTSTQTVTPKASTPTLTPTTTAKQRCEANIRGCSEADLCEIATFIDGNIRKWYLFFTAKFVEEAKRRGLTCGTTTDNGIKCTAGGYRPSKGLEYMNQQVNKFVKLAKEFNYLDRNQPLLSCDLLGEDAAVIRFKDRRDGTKVILHFDDKKGRGDIVMREFRRYIYRPKNDDAPFAKY